MTDEAVLGTTEPFQSIFVDYNAGIRKDPRLLIREIFHTLQGEMPYAGRKATFIRTGGCNLGAKLECPWCDTDFMEDKSVEMEVGEVIRALQFIAHPDDLLVISGGEPGLQSKQLAPLIDALAGRQFQYESNGMHKLYNEPPNVETVISPKTAGHKWVDYRLYERNVNERTWFRFVVEHKPDSPYYDLPHWARDPAWLKEWRDRCFISPITQRESGELSQSIFDEGIDQQQTAANRKWAVQLVDATGMRLSTQSHLVFGIR